MSKERDSKKRVALVQLFAESRSPLSYRVRSIFPTGEWAHPMYGPMIITSESITEFKQNFDDGIKRVMMQHASQPMQRSATSLRLPPVCSQCHRPMRIERIEPDLSVGQIAIFRCEQCRLKDRVWASNIGWQQMSA